MMDSVARQKIGDRLLKARESLDRMRAVHEHPTKLNAGEFRRNWSEFLSAANGIFTMLEQVTKNSAAGRAWMGSRKYERRHDSLLSYMQHARNAEEHGIDAITDLEPGRLVFQGPEGDISSIENFDGKRGRYQNISASPDLRTAQNIRFYPQKPRLRPVVDRGVNFELPKEHLGAEIHDVSPVSVGGLFLNYVARIAVEAFELT
jgi:hypothetical protein